MEELQDMNVSREDQIVRLEEAGISMTKPALKEYLEAPGVLEGQNEPEGYKACGGCNKTKKLALFNRNKGARLNCTGTCKLCQREAARASYERNKDKNKQRAYYQKNKEERKAKAREYYERNKENVLEQQASYRQTEAGQRAAKKSGKRRRQMLRDNAGIPYTRDDVITRDTADGATNPTCILCGGEISESEELHMEHLIPIKQGGRDCFTNVAASHAECNLKKTEDAQEIKEADVLALIERAEEYMENNQKDFPSIFKH